MPGNGTFNLAALWRALGIKNPQTSVSERLQPVLIASDMSGLTPQHQAPTGAFGGDLGQVAGEFGFIELISQDPGGCWMEFFAANQPVNFAIAPRSGLGIVSVDAGPFSIGRLVSRVLSDTLASSPVPLRSNTPITHAVTTSQTWMRAPRLFVPQGDSMFFVTTGVNIALTNWTIIVTGVPASEIPEA